MSRSRKKKPFTGYSTKDSDKYYKQLASRRFRKHEKNLLDQRIFEITEARNKFSESYSFAKDGKQFFNPEDFPKALRK